MNGWQIFIEVPGKPPYELRPGESIVGRSRTTQIQVADSTVSRQHARLLSTGLGELSVEDLGSSNGSWVNGERIEGRSRLRDGDRLQVGDVELRVRIVAPVSAQEATVRMKVPPRPSAPPAEPAAPPPPAPPARPEAPPARPAQPPPEAGVPRGTVPLKAIAAEPSAPSSVEPSAPPEAAAPSPAPEVEPSPEPPPVVPPSAPPAEPPAPPPTAPTPPSPLAAPEPPAPAPPADPPWLPAPPPRPAKDDSPYATPPVELPVEPEVDARAAASSDLLGPIDEPEPAPVFAAGPVRPGSELPSVTAIDRIPIPEVSPAVVRASKLSRARPAGFGARVAAVVVDALLLAAITFGASIAFGSTLRLNPGLAAMVSGVLAVVPFLYVLLFWALRGATPGKMLLGLEIVPDGPSSGRGLGVSTALVRALGYLLSAALLGVGFLLPLFTTKKQALHDLIAKTRVVRLS